MKRRRSATWAAASCLFVCTLICAAAARAEMIRYAVNPGESEVTTVVADPFARFRGDAVGTFKVISGEIWFDPANPASAAKVKVTIDAASYTSDRSNRDRAVTRALETDLYPTITFDSTGLTNVVTSGTAGGSAVVLGNLTLHGTTQPLEVLVSASMSPDGVLDARGEVTFRYSDFGIRPPSILLGALHAGEQVTVKFQIFAAPVHA